MEVFPHALKACLEVFHPQRRVRAVSPSTNCLPEPAEPSDNTPNVRTAPGRQQTWRMCAPV